MRVLCLCLASTLVGLTLSATCLAAAPTASGVATLHALFDQEWAREEREDPVAASLRGDRMYNGRWPDRSLATIEASHRADLEALAALARIDRGALPPEEQLNYDLFQWKYQDRLQSWHFHEYVFPLNQLDGIQTSDELTQRLRFTTLKDYQDWLGRLRSFGSYMDQTLALLKQGVDEGRVLPKVVVERIQLQITMNAGARPEKSPFYAPFLTPAKLGDPAAMRALQSAARTAIASNVIPAFQRMREFFARTYAPHARSALAVTTLPEGDAYYRYLVRHFTTTQMQPEQVHELGLKLMSDIHGEMLQAMQQADFKGSFADFLEFLRSAPRFHYTDGAQLLAAYKVEAKTIDPLLVGEFGRLPRIPWGIEPIPADQAPNTYPAYSVDPAADGSRAAYMDVNLYKPETRPIYEIPVLTCHEGRPGHALQLSLATELKDLPNFRRFGYFNAYGEGWALYAETLCGEMGLYDDPYKRFAALSYQMWRAVRLVVDTGIHRYGMSRASAVDLFMKNTALSQQNIETEIDRYIAWPGQALCYMIGERKIRELRERATRMLGPRFDVKEFHDVILQGGTMPLDVLEKVVDDWIRSADQSRRSVAPIRDRDPVP
ncbi:MAG TPA: DUF885 domain-containing protein [Steroidobacteraceae bacterium]|nr:DUF885 domain-containing protein [Steroidobacteraceae bacterium]